VQANSAAQSEIIAFLSESASYGPQIRTVERHETHGAIVFLAGDRAYKLKRAVKFPYMDYSSVERRREMCTHELAVNRRMAPELYLEVRPIIRDGASLRFGREDEPARAIDWVVVMRRFNQEALLESMRRSGHLTLRLMRLVAEALARVHGDAEVRRDFGGESAIREVIANSVALLKTRIDQPFCRNIVEHYESVASVNLTRITPLLEERRVGGRVRRCHGDLHLNNIFVQNGIPVLFDAIEFNDRFAFIDVLYDLAFLLMDLDRHSLRAHANTVFNRYLDLSSEHDGLGALPLFMSCRASIRAHTAVSAAEAIDHDAQRDQLLKDAVVLLDKAVSYLGDPKPRLVAIGGLSGTGKSTLAYGLAPCLGLAPGAVVIRSDVIRKQLIGVPESVRLPATAYTPSVSKKVYERIAEIASTTVASGFSAIADAVYGTEEEREEIAAIARRGNVPFDGLWLEGPKQILEQRIAARVGDASDATPDVLRAQLNLVTKPHSWSGISTIGSAEETLARVRALLRC
jgi:aminoglycoside phosphotransferase family enzyme/predicted kinase